MALQASKAKVSALIKDRPAEIYIRWAWKRLKGIPIPLDNVRNEIYDRQAFEIMSRVLDEDSNAIDVGCHLGSYLRKLFEFAPRGTHFAFEPIPPMAAALREQFPSVNLFEMALSDKVGSAEFFYFLDKPALSGLARRNDVTSGAQAKRIDVRVAPLDSLIPAHTPIHFMKIDVEGAEGLVLSGAKDLIGRDRPFILFEHGRNSSAHFGWTSEALFDFLTAQCGLKVSRVEDWLNERSPLTKLEFAKPGGWYFLAHP
jgi:FkbM family methyltransferase